MRFAAVFTADGSAPGVPDAAFRGAIGAAGGVVALEPVLALAAPRATVVPAGPGLGAIAQTAIVFGPVAKLLVATRMTVLSSRTMHVIPTTPFGAVRPAEGLAVSAAIVRTSGAVVRSAAQAVPPASGGVGLIVERTAATASAIVRCAAQVVPTARLAGRGVLVTPAATALRRAPQAGVVAASRSAGPSLVPVAGLLLPGRMRVRASGGGEALATAWVAGHSAARIDLTRCGVRRGMFVIGHHEGPPGTFAVGTGTRHHRHRR